MDNDMRWKTVKMVEPTMHPIAVENYRHFMLKAGIRGKQNIIRKSKRNTM